MRIAPKEHRGTVTQTHLETVAAQIEKLEAWERQLKYVTIQQLGAEEWRTAKAVLELAERLARNIECLKAVHAALTLGARASRSLIKNFANASGVLALTLAFWAAIPDADYRVAGMIEAFHNDMQHAYHRLKRVLEDLNPDIDSKQGKKG